MFGRSNMRYMTFVLGAAIVVEVVYGGVTDMLWESSNKGKLPHHIDWTSWREEDEEDEDEDGDDDDEDEE